jgi:prepilin-type N-terminal cleavage/methylation domain-containing protein
MTNWIVSFKSSKGFTLIEMIAILLILGLVAAFAVPRWTARTTNLYAQTNNLLNDIRYTQNLAMTQGQRYRINLMAPNTYSITTLTGTAVINPGSNTTVSTLGTGIQYGTITNLPSSLISFDGKGKPYIDSGATTALTTTATIVLTTGSANYTISISPGTGRAVVS